MNCILLDGRWILRYDKNEDFSDAFEKFKTKGHKVQKVNKPPTLKTMEKWMLEDGIAKATDGCIVEPDGKCCHGHQSWLRVYCLI